jgi:uncharacterized membrane protein
MKLLRRSNSVLYPGQYLWFVLLSFMDVAMTAVILSVGGWEVNSLANHFLSRFDLMGLVMLKVCIITFFLTVCEMVGRRNKLAGRRLVLAAILITMVPILVGSVELFLYAWPAA